MDQSKILCGQNEECVQIFKNNGACCHCKWTDNALHLMISGYPYMESCITLPEWRQYFEFKQHRRCSKVFFIDDALPKDLAKACREFVQKVPFDPTTPLINNTTNKPQTAILDSKYNFKLEEENSSPISSHWKWEHYKRGIWRLTPPDWFHFIQSPIAKLLYMIRNLFYQQPDFPQKYRPTTWVIQLQKHGEGIGLHQDETKDRRISFIYYLTPSDWNYRVHGGALHIADENFEINPCFNKLVMWKLNGVDWKSPLHSVLPVTREDQYRIALVGFFSELQ